MGTEGKSQPLSFPHALLTMLTPRVRPSFGFIVGVSISYLFCQEESPLSVEQIFVTAGL